MAAISSASKLRPNSLAAARTTTVAAVLLASVCGYLSALFALTRSNGFWPVPWQHDDYYNLVPAFPGAKTMVIRPVSTFALHALAFISPHAVYAVMIALVIISITLATFLVKRWMHLELSLAAHAAIAFCAATGVGLAESAPFVVRYTGSFTHLLSSVLALTSVLAGLAFIERRRGAIVPLAGIFVLAVLAKEDVPAFVTMSLLLFTLLEYRDTRDPGVMRRGIVAVSLVIVISLSAIAFNFLQSASFVNTTLKGASGYGLSSPVETLRHFVFYLGTGRLIRLLDVLVAISALVILLRFRRQTFLRYVGLGVMILAMILPYAMLSKTHLYDYYTIIWLPMLAVSAAAGSYLVFNRFRLPGAGGLIVGILIIVLAHRVSRLQRDSVATWLTMHQRKNANIIYGLREYRDTLAGYQTVYVAGVDETFSPFFFGDGGYANHLVGNPKLDWVVIAHPDSWMWDSYNRANFPLSVGHVRVSDAIDGNTARPLLSFDPTFRATLIR